MDQFKKRPIPFLTGLGNTAPTITKRKSHLQVSIDNVWHKKETMERRHLSFKHCTQNLLFW
jgi:hypothetical protein